MINGKAIRIGLAETGRTYRDLSQALGVTPATVYRWQSGKALPRAEHLPRLSRVLGKSVAELLGDESGERHERWAER